MRPTRGSEALTTDLMSVLQNSISSRPITLLPELKPAIHAILMNTQTEIKSGSFPVSDI